MSGSLQFKTWRLCENIRLTAEACQPRVTRFPTFSVPIPFLRSPATMYFEVKYSDDTKFKGRHTSCGFCRILAVNSSSIGDAEIYYHFGNGMSDFPAEPNREKLKYGYLIPDLNHPVDDKWLQNKMDVFYRAASMYDGYHNRFLRLVETIVDREEFFGVPGVYVLSYDGVEWNFPYVIVDDMRDGTTITRIPDPYHFIDEWRDMELRVLNDGDTQVCFVNKSDPSEEWTRLNELDLEQSRLLERVLLSINQPGIKVVKY